MITELMWSKRKRKEASQLFGLSPGWAVAFSESGKRGNGIELVEGV